jgi:hypothetical protein
MAFQINKNSWLNMADLLNANDDSVSGSVTFWDTPDFPSLIPQKEDTYVTIDQQHVGRLDLMAYQQYGDPDLWWIIALANDINVIPTDVILGMSVRIPPKSYVDSYIAGGGRK